MEKGRKFPSRHCSAVVLWARQHLLNKIVFQSLLSCLLFSPAQAAESNRGPTAGAALPPLWKHGYIDETIHLAIASVYFPLVSPVCICPFHVANRKNEKGQNRKCPALHASPFISSFLLLFLLLPVFADVYEKGRDDKRKEEMDFFLYINSITASSRKLQSLGPSLYHLTSPKAGLVSVGARLSSSPYIN